MGGQQDNHDRQSLTMMLWLVWLSLLFSLFIYVAVILVIPAPEKFVPPEIASGRPPKILVILGMAAITLVPILLNIRKRMFFEPLGEKCHPGSEEARSSYFTMSLTSWILCELIGVFGFVIHFLTYQPVLALPFVVLAGVLMVAFRPKPGVAEEELGMGEEE
jgi:hypothetical protein